MIYAARNILFWLLQTSQPSAAYWHAKAHAMRSNWTREYKRFISDQLSKQCETLSLDEDVLFCFEGVKSN